MAKIIKLYLLTLVVFLGLDSIWLSQIAPKLYKHYIGFLLADNPNLIAALAFYLLFAAGMVYLALLPALKKKSLATGILNAATLGLVCYATFDLTNLSVIKNWPVAISLIDMLWGTVLSTISIIVAYKISEKFIK